VPDDLTGSDYTWAWSSGVIAPNPSVGLKPAARNWAIMRVHEVCTWARGYAAIDTVLQAPFASPVASCVFACSACVIAFFASAMNSSSSVLISSCAMGSPSSGGKPHGTPRSRRLQEAVERSGARVELTYAWVTRAYRF
jgi:hypothetical protein